MARHATPSVSSGEAGDNGAGGAWSVGSGADAVVPREQCWGSELTPLHRREEGPLGV